MAKLAYSYGYRSIQAIDLVTKREWSLETVAFNAEQFDITDDGTIYYVMKNGFKKIRQTAVGSGSGADTLFYEHPTYVRDIAVRLVSGNIRVFFRQLARMALMQFFYLSEQKVPIQYYVVNPEDIALYNSCTGKEDWPFYSGDFAFGPNNTLYISNGNCSPCAIYRISGAGPDDVVGGIERIYQSADAIESLACDDNYIYFRQSTKTISQLGMVSLWKSDVYTINMGGVHIADIAIAPEQVLGTPPEPSFLFIRLAKWVWLRVLQATKKSDQPKPNGC